MRALGRRQVGKAAAFEAAMRWFESIRPSQVEKPVSDGFFCKGLAQPLLGSSSLGARRFLIEPALMTLRQFFVTGTLLAGLTMAACNGPKTSPLATPSPSPSATPCSAQASVSSFASQASNATIAVPSVDNISASMSSGTLSITPAATTLMTGVTDYPCHATAIMGATTAYLYIALSAGSGTIGFPSYPGFTFTFPAGTGLAGKTFTLSAFNAAAATWSAIATGTVSGQSVTFASSGAGFTLDSPSGTTQILGLSSP
ncbi:MAG: hypothetical protein NVS9B12_09640 [Vulcanimicrobiaceae bacterium]